MATKNSCDESTSTKEAESCPTKSVVIVGGGIAGLACGLKLASTPGFKVTLLEATDEIGGRVKTAQFGDDGHVELGAQWVHGEKGNSVFSLVQPFDVLEDDRVSPKFGLSAMFVTQRGEFLSDVIETKVLALMEQLQVTASAILGIKDNEPLGQFATRIFWKFHEQSPFHVSESICAGILDWIHRFQNSIDGADSWFVTSCRGQLAYTSCEGNPTIGWKRPANYATLLQILLHGRPQLEEEPLMSFPNWIHLKKEVKSIVYDVNNEGVKVHCKDGSTYTADNLVSTVSLGVLKRKHTKLFQPPLPPKKVNAIENLGFGVVDKIFLEFGSAWWPQNSLGFNLVWDDCCKVNENWLPDPPPNVLYQEDESGIPRWCRSLLGFYTLKNRPKTLFTWVTGPPAEFMESLDTETLELHLVKVLRKFVGGVFTVPNPIAIMRSAWKSNAHTRGSYSFRTVQSEEKAATAEELAQPILTSGKKPVVCFAGEATHPNFYSTVHGAYDTGVREADRLIYQANEESVSSQAKIGEPGVEEGGGFCCTLLDYV